MLLHRFTGACVIFMGSITNLPFVVARRHPYNIEAPLIDYVFLSLVTPPLLAGVRLGVFVNKISPNWAIAFTLVRT